MDEWREQRSTLGPIVFLFSHHIANTNLDKQRQTGEKPITLSNCQKKELSVLEIACSLLDHGGRQITFNKLLIKLFKVVTGKADPLGTPFVCMCEVVIDLLACRFVRRR